MTGAFSGECPSPRPVVFLAQNTLFPKRPPWVWLVCGCPPRVYRRRGGGGGTDLSVCPLYLRRNEEKERWDGGTVSQFFLLAPGAAVVAVEENGASRGNLVRIPKDRPQCQGGPIGP